MITSYDLDSWHRYHKTLWLREATVTDISLTTNYRATVHTVATRNHTSSFFRRLEYYVWSFVIKPGLIVSRARPNVIRRTLILTVCRCSLHVAKSLRKVRYTYNFCTAVMLSSVKRFFPRRLITLDQGFLTHDP